MILSLRVLIVVGLLSVAAFPVCAESNKMAQSGVVSETRAEQEIHQALNAWFVAISTGSSDAVMKLYTKDAVLLPTLSPKVSNTPELRKAYFDAFTAKADLKGVADEEHIRVFGKTAINSGLYTFTFTKDGETVTVPARFSFVYHKTPQGWMIVDHHSSRLPVEP